MDGTRSALIIAGSHYADPALRQLQAPASDARALATVLEDPEIGAFEVRTLLDRPAYEVNLAVEEFFADRKPHDTLLVHFSCHGVKSDEGELYFAMADTMVRRLGATAVAADFVNRQMNRSRSQRIVLLLDCCYAGAFVRGMTARAGGGVGIEDQFSGGRGKAVITAATAMEYAFESGELTDARERAPSVFTSALVEGLRTGEADRDQDGLITLDEFYDYIYDKVRTATPSQTPGKFVNAQGELVIARRSRPVTTPALLPADLQEALDNRLAVVRVGAVQELERLLHGRHEGLALAARLALEQLTSDDSRMVGTAAAAALSMEERPQASPKHELSASQPVPTVPESVEPVPGAVPTRSEPQQSAASVEDQPVPKPPRPVAGTTQLPAQTLGPNAQRLLSAGFIILIAVLCVKSLYTLITITPTPTWPLWVMLVVSIPGIAVTLGGVRMEAVSATVLLCNLAWLAIFSLVRIATIKAVDPYPVIFTVYGIGAVANLALCTWMMVLRSKHVSNVDAFLPVFTSCFSIGLIFGAMAFGVQGAPTLKYVAGFITLAAALVVLVTLLRARRPATTR